MCVMFSSGNLEIYFVKISDSFVNIPNIDDLSMHVMSLSVRLISNYLEMYFVKKFRFFVNTPFVVIHVIYLLVMSPGNHYEVSKTIEACDSLGF